MCMTGGGLHEHLHCKAADGGGHQMARPANQRLAEMRGDSVGRQITCRDRATHTQVRSARGGSDLQNWGTTAMWHTGGNITIQSAANSPRLGGFFNSLWASDVLHPQGF